MCGSCCRGVHFVCVDASLDWRYDDSLDRVDFTFDGCDEGTRVSSRGWARNLRDTEGVTLSSPDRGIGAATGTIN